MKLPVPYLRNAAEIYDRILFLAVERAIIVVMDQETPQNQLEQELQAVGGLPLTHDKLFREVFQWLELARAFLRFVLPKKVREKLDLDGLTIEPKDFLSLIFRETRADMIYRVPILGSERTLCY